MREIKILLDGFGGDNAPISTVEGSVEAVKENKNIKVIIVGDEIKLKNILSKYDYEDGAIEVCHASEVIETAEHPVHAIRNKKDSSLVVGLKKLKEKEADAFVSAGNSGAVLVGGQTIVGRLKGVKSAPLATILPTAKGASMLLDSGARVDINAETLVKYAYLAKAYMKSYFGNDNPTIGILNIGAEEEKGNQLVQEAFPLLKEATDLNFVGSIEARNVPYGEADIVLAEGFTGNVLLKTYEGVSKVLISEIKKSMMSSIKSKIGALLIKSSLKNMLKRYDASKYGGAPLLGCKGIILKTHGNAKKSEIKNTILQGAKLAQNNFIEDLNSALND